ncbi:hypothetical protein GRI62_09805 [Erythrobacter arachoides]|uniref:Exo-alpha-sialidase n=1 Tax=Aurantiacibacter arachoides TaxID=1850444 RepID=A0A845A4P6_9SPHN|nr:hypothetical protein [Aurantiacibacter arachoides]MXO93897.1 hypothetical protein [Aurantiacibacter arachoides]GGD45801.1 hypothetical protein GCM10011411_01770 [Aurantiacibacter arachoides]
MSESDLAYRVRSDIAAPLNGDSGWAAGIGTPAVVEVDRPFRVRMEVAASPDPRRYALQARRNGGEWETLEAHDFPYPNRELELQFGEQAPGSPAAGWTIAAGAAGSLAIVEDAPSNVLRASGDAGGLLAIYPAPWPLPEFSIATRFRVPSSGSGGFAMLFGFVDEDNYGLVRFQPENGIRIERIVDGRPVLLAQRSTGFARNVWQDAEIELEGGTIQITLGDEEANLQAPLSIPAGEVGIAVAAGEVVDIDELTIEGVARTPGVSIVAAPAYDNGTATTDLLDGTSLPFVSATGISLRELAPSLDRADSHGEFEWPLVIRRFADGPLLNENGDRFEFRMIDPASPPASASAIAKVSITVPPGHLGGTFVETPGRIGPWQTANGDLYFIMEPTETDNKFMMVKSSDGGRSWQEVDGANRPATGDLEAVDGRRVDRRIHIIHQVTESVSYHVFRTSDHPTHPDSWELVDEVAARADAIAQAATIAVRSNGSVVSVFLAERLYYVVRAPDGTWSAPVELDPGERFINTGPQAIVGRDDVVHLAYASDDGGIWYRRLLADGTLTQRWQIAGAAGTSRADYGAVLPLAYDAQTDMLTIAYRLSDGMLWERQIQGGSEPTQPRRISDRPVVTDAVDSQQPAGDITHDGNSLIALFVDNETRSIFSSVLVNNRWQTPRLEIDEIEGSWVRGNIIRRHDGQLVYGYVYDAGSQGGAGRNEYAELVLERE